MLACLSTRGGSTCQDTTYSRVGVGHALNPKMVSYTIWGGCLNDFKKKNGI